MNNEERQKLWEEYSRRKTSDLYEKIIIEYAGLVKIVAGRLSMYLGHNVEYDDLVGYGTFGLLDAIEKFDYSKGYKFETYASLRIRGAIIDSIRELDWVPRSLRQKNKELERVYAELENDLGHSANDQEVAEKLGVSLDELYKLLNEVNLSSLVSLEEFLEQNYEVGTNMAGSCKEDRPEGYMEITELREILVDAIGKLPEKEKTVVSFYYFEDLTLKEISAIMKVSESRISQLHTKAILRLRGKLARHRTILAE
jgi:RNA polymerase sigma factor for flagellar operon FliA